ncbi:MAG: superoxide dismutase family protein [Paenisporosarcina sp.]
MKKWLILICVGLISGCSDETTLMPVTGEITNSLTIDVVDTTGKSLGKGELTETSKGISLRLQVKGLAPGVKGIHFHDVGLCEPPDFNTAGSHVNPTGKEHGFKNKKGYHAGDLPNLVVPENGEVDLQIVTPLLTLSKGKANSLLDENGSALIIHEKADDYVTDPSGNSGNRIACGAIK